METKILFPFFERGDLRADEFGGSLEQYGCVGIRHAFDAGIAFAAYHFARTLFRLSDDVKLRYRLSGGRVGYTPAGIEGVAGASADPSRHFWNMTRPSIMKPVWPHEIFALGTFYENLYNLFDELTNDLAAPLGEFLGKPSGYFEMRSRGAPHLLRINHYPTLTEGIASAVRFPAHRDFGLLTIYLGGAASGLEIYHKDRWHTIGYIPHGDVVVAAGNILAMESAGRISAVRHRVFMGGKERFSIVFFGEPLPNVVLPTGEYASNYLARLSARIRRE